VPAAPLGVGGRRAHERDGAQAERGDADGQDEIGVEEQPVVPLYFDENIVVYNAARLTGYRALRYGVSLAEVAWR